MSKFEHSTEIIEKYPKNFTACFGRIQVKDSGLIEQAVDKLFLQIKETYTCAPVQVSQWQEVFKKMGASPKYKSSITTLWEKFSADGRLYNILPLVDFYNVLSLLYCVPMAAYDADRIDGDIYLRFARKGESFTPLGNPKQTEKTKSGEIVYADNAKVICRYWNLKDCDETKILKGTKYVLVFADIIADNTMEAQERANSICNDLKTVLGNSLAYGLTGLGLGNTYSFSL